MMPSLFAMSHISIDFGGTPHILVCQIHLCFNSSLDKILLILVHFNKLVSLKATLFRKNDPASDSVQWCR